MNAVTLNEVSLRDGLQFEEKPVSLEAKHRYAHSLAEAGAEEIEYGSIVTPAVKQMQNSDVLTDILLTETKAGQFPGVKKFHLLTVNRSYAEAAIEAGISKNFGQFAVVFGATDANCQSNLRTENVDAAIQKLVKPVIELGKVQEIPVRAYISVIFEAEPAYAAKLCKQMLDMGAYEVVPSDTTGIGTPDQVEALLQALEAEGISLDKVALHFHGTPENVNPKIQRAYDLGIRKFDCAAGGIGGCAFADKKIPNADTAAVVNLFEEQGVTTGINIEKLAEASRPIMQIIRPSSSTVKEEFTQSAEKNLLQGLHVENDDRFNFKNINIKIDERGVVYIALNRPEKHNAFNDDLIQEIRDAIAQLGEIDDVKIIRFSGEGPSFCSGADLNYMAKMATYDYGQNVEDASKLARMFRAIKDCPKAIVGALHRNTLAGATGLVSGFDYNIAIAGTKFQIGERNLGMRPSTISPFVVGRVGAHNAAILFTEGKPFFANRAVEYGLVDQVCLPGELEQQSEAVIAFALQQDDPKLALQQLRQDVVRVQSYKPYPQRFSILTTMPEQVNHNKILDLVEKVSELIAEEPSAERNEKIIQFTAADIAQARGSQLAKDKIAEFLTPKPPKGGDPELKK
jgi:enoyl-CoA hydratase/carnithine racemase/isopropylmalate/homocitrate/citramalate synthase